ncbi:MAG: hypothetical protein U1F57_02930, partial [bacterium]
MPLDTQNVFLDSNSPLLARCSHLSLAETSRVSSTQAEFDRFTSEFIQETTDLRSVACMMLGGIAFRLGRIGVLSLAPLARSTPLWRLASYGAGLAMETTAFEAASNLTSPEGLRNAEFS